jgi:hypothetical protein
MSAEASLLQELSNIKNLMADFPRPWFVAGGWALDLAAGHVHREHEDIDLCIFREDMQAVLDHFAEWDIQVAIPGEQRLEPCRTVEDVLPPRYGLHLRRGTEFVEILLTDRAGDQVVFRKDASITMSLKRFANVDPNGIPYVAPEWQMLYKAKEGREKDQFDFDTHAPRFDEEAKQWFRVALQKFLRASPWLAEL